MVKAGLFKWTDVIKDGKLDKKALEELKSRLLVLGKRTGDAAVADIQRYQRNLGTPGPKASRPGAFYPGRKVYVGPRWQPNALPNRSNIAMS